MVRRIIQIDKEKCNGCGLCADACHEGAIKIAEGKAELMRDDYCDGLGDCLPACPTKAISFVEREAAAYDKEAVERNKKGFLGCPGSRSMELKRKEDAVIGSLASRLKQWPVQIKLAPVTAPYFQDRELLVAADCSAYAYGGFHETFMKHKVTLIGCPKLDSVDYSEKLSQILKNNSIAGITVVRMEVPCCGGLENAVITALREAGKDIPCQVVTLSTGGEILREQEAAFR